MYDNIQDLPEATFLSKENFAFRWINYCTNLIICEEFLQCTQYVETKI